MAKRKPKGFKLHTELEGSKELARTYKRLGKSAELEVGKVLYLEGESIMADSKELHVPVKDGPLKASGHVQFPRPGPLVLLGYGGPAVPYALRQHEELLWQHEVGRAKYLEIPMVAHIPGMPKRLAKDLERWLQRHGIR